MQQSKLEDLTHQAAKGFQNLNVGDQYKTAATHAIQQWLSDEQFKAYLPQLIHLIQNEHWDYLLDSFYQVIPFGTGGRRGEVGIGPNRINPWTIQSSAQGHSQYLIKKYRNDAKTRGVVLSFDVREFYSNKYFNDHIANPVRNLTCKDLAKAAAEVYAANGIKVYFFDDVRTTPELSFAIRHLHSVGGDMFSASHNPPEHNGKKVYDECGGQLIPPHDEELVKEVTANVRQILRIKFDDAVQQSIIQVIGKEVDDAYIDAASMLSLSSHRAVTIAYSPLHGCGSTSVLKVLRKLGFKVQEDPKTSNPSGKFENVTFNIPNPEVEQSFDTPLQFAKSINADILLNSDPDADRIGIMVHHKESWVFLNGNEIAAILCEYAISKQKSKLSDEGVVIKTLVTSNSIREICQRNHVRIIGDLLVGFKYIAEEMNRLEQSGNIENFLFGCEESHGYIAGNYVRDKDAVVPAIWLSELGAELKAEKKTLVDYLNMVYATYGYFRNYLTEIRLPGAEGKSKIDKIQADLRTNPPKNFGRFAVEKVEDYQDRLPIVSETDRASKDMLAFHFKPVDGTVSIKITVRPSGTEPKIKMYYEIGSNPFSEDQIDSVKSEIEKLRQELEKEFMKTCYKIVGVDFPDRGFLLFWQLPLEIKMKYFEVEPEIEILKQVTSTGERQKKLDDLLKFLGSDPISKVDKAFQEKYHQPLLHYLALDT